VSATTRAGGRLKCQTSLNPVRPNGATMGRPNPARSRSANCDHGIVPDVTSGDDLADAVAAYRHARADIDAARDQAAQIIADAKAEAERRRAMLADAIVRAARAGMRQRDIVEITGYNRERIRQVVRDAGIEPDD
jgi:hypothetical protein